ncbi:hypothetical protein [Actinophytocola gossypii]|uniref:Integral membrane protein n=1 Tax=Actinophytocola gossypii TaxID=2812003 RepID=A0ABT2JHM6_9PSEU|nr:hypothetical protein [Actinophytocola gossypii]MCT2586900.1 hypothetical protein [Actinophytocola gossypii]
MSTTTVPAAGVSSPLRRLYFVRFAFALVWAGLLFATASSLGPVGVTLLVLYPVFDLGAAIVDARSSSGTRPVSLLYVNVAISLLAAAGLAVAASSGIPAVLRVWGAWAIVSGLVQLGVGVVRRGLGGQWPMIASGGLSAVVGGTFIAQAAAAGPSLTNVAGYAAVGGVFFLVSALRQG